MGLDEYKPIKPDDDDELDDVLIEELEVVTEFLVVFSCNRYKSNNKSSKFNFDRSRVWSWLSIELSPFSFESDASCFIVLTKWITGSSVDTWIGTMKKFF